MERIRESKLVGPAIEWMEEHPRLTAWIALSIGMVAILLFEARDVGLLPGQWLALIVATVAVAGISIWIVSWDEEEGETPTEAEQEPTDEAEAEHPETPSEPEETQDEPPQEE